MLIKHNPSIESICRRISTLSGEIDRGNFTSDKELFLISTGQILSYCIAMVVLFYSKHLDMSPESAVEAANEFFAALEEDSAEFIDEIMKGPQ